MTERQIIHNYHVSFDEQNRVTIAPSLNPATTELDDPPLCVFFSTNAITLEQYKVLKRLVDVLQSAAPPRS